MNAHSSSQGQTRGSAPFLGRAVLAAGFAWAAMQFGPVFREDGIQPIPAVLYLLAVSLGMEALSVLLRNLAKLADWKRANTGTGKSGTARWATWRDLRKELSRKKTGPFWGLLAGTNKPLFIDYASNSMTVAPAGSGKGITTVVPMGFAIRESKVWADFKGELVCILKDALEKRGEIVRVLNPSGLWSHIVGQSDCYNPLDVIVDDLYRPSGLRDVPDDLREMCAQLLPEPAGSQGDNGYFREGGRRLMADAILIEAMVEGYDATLSSVALLIEDRNALENNLRWIVGVDLNDKPLPGGPMPLEQAAWAQVHDPEELAAFAKLVRARAAAQLALLATPDSRTFESFISGGQQALAPFAFGRLAGVMGRSTFRIDDLKDANKPVNLFIVADASRMEAYKPYMGLIQWCAMTAIKRHENKAKPVHFIMDEATNFKIHGLEDLLTWGRGYGLRLHLIFQDLSAFERVYGRTALETLLSECEIRHFLPGQRSPKTLDMIAKMLGEQSVMGASLSRREDRLHAQLSESGRVLMNPDEIRRTPHGLLFVRQARPALIEPVAYSAISPWRKLAGINPFHGKPFLKKVRLRLRG